MSDEETGSGEMSFSKKPFSRVREWGPWGWGSPRSTAGGDVPLEGDSITLYKRGRRACAPIARPA